ncbi:MAG TPA: zf-HC2 domain-containing protein [Pyrinomonadaceae bacterium]|jgi:anti-sigma factor RsiW|nr:zf-HC2 domain-containing protein [Pyrinomonadaceae bacterium]
MRCTRVEKFLPLYVAGDLAGRRAERHVARHLATCERCRGLAEEYDASRDFVRAAAGTLPPDFDDAFYAGIRRSVLAEIKREHTRLAPPSPTFAGFASLFNPRFAYAASVALLLIAIAALSLQSYVGRKSEIAGATGGHTGTPAATTVSIKTTARGDGRTVAPVEKTLAATASKESRQTAKPLSLKRRAGGSGNAQDETQRSLNFANNAPVRARRNPLAPSVAAPGEHTEQIASSGGSSGDGTTNAAPEVSRIEIQTSDPNIRIIWLSPGPDADAAQPLK